MDKDILFKDLSYQVIGICFKVHTALGCGLAEHCYNHALVMEFTKQGVPCTQQQRFDVHYNDEYVGHMITDIIVDNKIILELKSADLITKNHVSQLLTYLRTAKLKLGYVINFGVRHLQYKRLIL